MIFIVIIGVIVLCIGVYAKKRYDEEKAMGQANVIRTFSVETMSDLRDGTIDDFEEALEEKRREIESHVTWDVSSGVKIEMERAFARRIHDAENNVIASKSKVDFAVLKLKKSLKEIEEFHLKMGKLKLIKRRRTDYKLVARLIESWKECPTLFFRNLVKNPVENYSTGFELWCSVTFRKVHKEKFLKEAIKIQIKAAAAMNEFSTALELQKNAEEELNRLLALRQKYKHEVYIMLP